MEHLQLVQGSAPWLAARCGSLGASQVHEALAKTTKGWGAGRANTMATLVVERLTGCPSEGFTNAAMQWGTATEPQARDAYSFHADVDVEQVGLIKHPQIAGTHASPDGLIGEDGLTEIKCPQSATHIATLLGEPIAGKYVTQVQWQLACTGRAWCDWVSFDPRLPGEMQLFVQRIQRDDAMIADLEREVAVFLAEVAAKVEQLQARYSQREAA
jgi:predicted phage-related endonuclease